MMTIKDLYNEIVNVNTVTYSNGWVNPKMHKAGDEFSEDYFFIKLDEFEEVTETPHVQIYNVSLKFGEKIINCKRRA